HERDDDAEAQRDPRELREIRVARDLGEMREREGPRAIEARLARPARLVRRETQHPRERREEEDPEEQHARRREQQGGALAEGGDDATETREAPLDHSANPPNADSAQSTATRSPIENGDEIPVAGARAWISVPSARQTT